MLIDPYRFHSKNSVGGNWDAEAGNMANWTTLQGNPLARGDSGTQQGAFHFEGGTSALTRASQQLDLSVVPGLAFGDIDNGVLHIIVDWWGGTFVQAVNDQPQLSLHFLDEDEIEISTHSSGFKSPTAVVTGNTRWQEYQEDVLLPAGTRFVDVEMQFKRNTGTNNDARIDDIRFRFST